jgi:hypothetical protein
LAGGLAGDRPWHATVGEAQLFGQRVTCNVLPDVLELLGAELDQIELSLAEVERAVVASQISASRAQSELAQLEAQLDKLQCKGVDAVNIDGSEAARAERRKLTQKAEVVQARLGGIFVGLKVASAAQGNIQR